MSTGDIRASGKNIRLDTDMMQSSFSPPRELCSPNKQFDILRDVMQDNTYFEAPQQSYPLRGIRNIAWLDWVA